MNDKNCAADQLDITELWNQKVSELWTKVRAIAMGDYDLHQEGLIGIRDGLLRDPDATDSYLLQAAKFAMSNYKNKGRSVDNGSRHATTKRLLDGTVKTYRKNMRRVSIDRLSSDFDLEFPDGSYPPDVRALDKVCAESFYESLDEDEAEFVTTCINRLGGRNYGALLSGKYTEVRESAYGKFVRAFADDEGALAAPRD